VAAVGGTNRMITMAMGAAGAIITAAVHLEQPDRHDHRGSTHW